MRVEIDAFFLIIHWQVYYVYGFMLLVFLILIIVTICVTIVGAYFLLNAENYHWQWTSFFSAASTAVYVYLYSVYYYHVKTKMSGFFQTSSDMSKSEGVKGLLKKLRKHFHMDKLDRKNDVELIV